MNCTMVTILSTSIKKRKKKKKEQMEAKKKMEQARQQQMKLADVGLSTSEHTNVLIKSKLVVAV